jgi:hypothetical protein
MVAMLDKSPETVRFSASRKKAILLLLGSLCFVAMGVWMSSTDPVVGWICVIFFGLGVPASLFMLWPNAMYLMLDADGFETGTIFSKHRTKWTDVAGFELASLHNTKIIAVHYTQQYQGQQLARKVATSLSGIEGAIPNSYNATLVDVLAALNTFRSRFG